MIVYWLLFLIPLCNIFFAKSSGRYTSQLGWKLYFFLLVIVIGLRFEVGGDWFTYLESLEIMLEMEWDDLFDFRREAGFTLLNWISTAIGLDVYGINLVCASIFSFGLIKFSKDQPYPWLAILIATPYLVIVVGMGYTRQAVALGLLMYSFKFLVENKAFKYLLIVGLAGLFHKTALIFLALVMLRPGSGIKVKLLGISALTILVTGSIVIEQAQFLLEVYVEQGMDSSGGPIRVLMNLPAALILMIHWRKWGELYKDRWLWSIIAILTIVSLPLVNIASTAVDRIALYFIPLQLVAFSRWPDLLSGKINRFILFGIVVVYYGLVQFVWLFFATHAPYWLPYKFFLWEWLWS